MPLDVARLRDSDFATEVSGDEFRAALLLWCASWHQKPAASLPDNDASLAKYAGYGRDQRAWKRVRVGALRGFSLCDDGRLYHAVIAEKAVEAWEGKLKLRHRKECERIKKAAQRAKADAIYPSFDEWKAHMESTGSDRWSPSMSQGTDEGRPDNVHGESHNLKGQGIGTGDRGQGTGDSSSASDSSSETHTPQVRGATEEARACVLMGEAGCKSTNPNHPELVAAIADGITPEALRDTAIEGISKGKTDPFAWACTTARRRKANGVTPLVQPSATKPKQQTPAELEEAKQRRAIREARKAGTATLPQVAADLARQLGVASA